MSDDEFGEFQFHHESPEIDCNHDDLSKEKEDGLGVYRFCTYCGRVFRMVPNGLDDFNWEETEELKEIA